jgi:haloacetate dehalogenase
MFEGFSTRDVDTSGARVHLRVGGNGPPVLLLHGYPQTHAMWHRIAPELAKRFTVVAADLRGYGDSGKPPAGADHAGYSKRSMAKDQIEAMQALGHERFAVVGHDRGARVTHRMCLDHPERVMRAAVLDICPTATMFAATDKAFATAYYHWFFLIQPFDLPERLIGADPGYYLGRSIGSWSRTGDVFAPEALAEYQRCFKKPETIHATCEDYRAAASIDLEHDAADASKKVQCPLLVLWGSKGVVGRMFDPIAAWREKAGDVSGQAIECGHFLPEERPQETLAALLAFLTRGG